MKIHRIAIVPAAVVVDGVEPAARARSPNGSVGRLQAAWQRWRGDAPKGFLYCGEVLHYAELASLLGENRVHVIGGYHPAYLGSRVQPWCTHPSCRGTPRAQFFASSAVESALQGVDAVIVSVRAGDAGLAAIRSARRHGLLVAMIDFFDHEELFDEQVDPALVYRGFVPERDFDVFFKKELMPRHRNSRLFPLAPVPVRSTSYAFTSRPKVTTVFYSGRPRAKQCQPERAEVVEAIHRDIPDAVVLSHADWDAFSSVRDYWSSLEQTRIALSPSGRVWDSYRHCEVGLAPRTALLCPEPYVETTGSPLRDGHNALLYPVRQEHGRYHVADSAALAEKLRFYLANPARLEAVAETWRKEVLETHTVQARARTLLGVLESVSA